ncbi:failed axon connections-like [Penaeus japonicus]|uniref:failed axon connections-like n=1 Tax=Penaeus japonicus TaxID=27405 RepID=UPI001C70DEF7|nr:failed axon connections-like [Penaeus japonicus]XP_042864504.1 failed axon connections-like [Penaeus japonicus]
MNILDKDLLETVWSNDWTRRGIVICIGVGVIISLRKVLKNRKLAKLRAEWNSAGKDVVVLHQFWRGKYCPNFSPYVLKVECFMRLAGIKYITDIQEPMGSRGLCPWITLNGEDIEDSQHIVDRLTKQFKVRLDDHLTPERKATLEAVRIMLEEQLFWILFMWRYYHTNCKTFKKTQIFPTWYLYYFFQTMLYFHAQKRGKAHGIARHTLQEQIKMTEKQMEILNVLLGDGQYFGGDQPCSVDCIVFGFLAQGMWNDTDSPLETLIKVTHPKLAAYCIRMKERIYPDWKKLLNPPQE